jgi:hypothetical protein
LILVAYLKYFLVNGTNTASLATRSLTGRYLEQ